MNIFTEVVDSYCDLRQGITDQTGRILKCKVCNKFFPETLHLKGIYPEGSRWCGDECAKSKIIL